VKTLAEQGIANVDTNNWYALFAPAKTPAATVVGAQASRAARPGHAGAEAPGCWTRARSPGAVHAAGAGRAGQADTDKWAKLIRDKKIKPE
jgi:hypothetical protein